MLACLHLEICSERLFNKWSCSSKLTTSSYSWRHNKHFFNILEYGGTNFTTDRFKVDISFHSFLISQIYLDNEYRLSSWVPLVFKWFCVVVICFLNIFFSTSILCLDLLMLMQHICIKCPSLGTIHLMGIYLSFCSCMIWCVVYGYSIFFYCEIK